jgi:hypothetical protein
MLLQQYDLHLLPYSSHPTCKRVRLQQATLSVLAEAAAAAAALLQEE